jgi:two-component sensor histidine kinase
MSIWTPEATLKLSCFDKVRYLIVTSLLRMQSSELRSEKKRISYSDANGRVTSLSLIHKKLYEEKKLSSIHYEQYINDLISEIKSFPGSDPDTHIYFDPNIREVGLKTIVPLGLLLNELITNSMKHGSAAGTNTQISISFHSSGNELTRMQFSD